MSTILGRRTQKRLQRQRPRRSLFRYRKNHPRQKTSRRIFGKRKESQDARSRKDIRSDQRESREARIQNQVRGSQQRRVRQRATKPRENLHSRIQRPGTHHAFEFPQMKPLTKSIADMLDDDVDEKYYYRSGWLYDRIKNQGMKEGVVYQWRRIYLRENKSSMCSTLTANMGMGGHNVPLVKDKKGMRRLTPRECARLQGFPEGYKLPKDVVDSKLYKQIGNSVTVSVVERIAKSMKEALDSTTPTEKNKHIFKQEIADEPVPRKGMAVARV